MSNGKLGVEELLTRGKQEDDAQAILQLMHRVKTRRDRLHHELGTSPHPPSQEVAPSTDSHVESLRSSFRRIRKNAPTRSTKLVREWKDDMPTIAMEDDFSVSGETGKTSCNDSFKKRHAPFRDNDSESDIEEDEFVDEGMDPQKDDPWRSPNTTEQQRRTFFFTRIHGLVCIVLAVAVVAIFITNIREANSQNGDQLHASAPSAAPPSKSAADLPWISTQLPLKKSGQEESLASTPAYEPSPTNGLESSPVPTYANGTAVVGIPSETTDPKIASTMVPAPTPLHAPPTLMPVPTYSLQRNPTDVWTPPYEGWEKTCFKDIGELDTAIKMYLVLPHPSNVPIVNLFGYPIGTWCVSAITDFSNLFSSWHHKEKELYENFNESLDGWDMSNAKSVKQMFLGAYSFEGNGLAKWNVSQVEDFTEFCRDCRSFNPKTDLSGWDLQSAKILDAFFEDAVAFRGQGLSQWRFPNAEIMDRMFKGCSSFTEDLGSWDVSNVKSMSAVFREASSFSCDLHEWRFSSELESISELFAGATAFNGRVDGWNIGDTRITSLERLFSRAGSFDKDVNSWDVSKITSFRDMFAGAISFDQNLTSWNTSSGEDFNGMFSMAASFNGDITSWDMSKAKTTKRMFSKATLFNQPIGSWNFLVNRDMSFMFTDALEFNQDLNKWNTRSVVRMTAMFDGARSFNGLISAWDLSEAESIDLMFRGASSFNQDISQWQLHEVLEMGGIFVSALRFNKNLCAWANSLKLRTKRDEPNAIEAALYDLFSSSNDDIPTEERLFLESGCPTQKSPTYENGQFIGPFCSDC